MFLQRAIAADIEGIPIGSLPVPLSQSRSLPLSLSLSVSVWVDPSHHLFEDKRLPCANIDMSSTQKKHTRTISGDSCSVSTSCSQVCTSKQVGETDPAVECFRGTRGQEIAEHNQTSKPIFPWATTFRAAELHPCLTAAQASRGVHELRRLGSSEHVHRNLPQKFTPLLPRATPRTCAPCGRTKLPTRGPDSVFLDTFLDTVNIDTVAKEHLTRNS